MTKAKSGRISEEQRGVATILVLLIVSLLSVLVAALLFQAYSDQVVAINAQDHIKTLGFAEAGLTWAQRRVLDSAGGFSDLLDGPDNSSTADDYMLGVRDLSLTSTSQFTVSNLNS